MLCSTRESTLFPSLDTFRVTSNGAAFSGMLRAPRPSRFCTFARTSNSSPAIGLAGYVSKAREAAVLSAWTSRVAVGSVLSMRQSPGSGKLMIQTSFFGSSNRLSLSAGGGAPDGVVTRISPPEDVIVKRTSDSPGSIVQVLTREPPAGVTGQMLAKERGVLSTWRVMIGSISQGHDVTLVWAQGPSQRA